jgi:hypothetical protein
MKKSVYYIEAVFSKKNNSLHTKHIGRLVVDGGFRMGFIVY